MPLPRPPASPPCSWLPTFYHQVYGVDVAGSSAYSVLPFVVTVAATNAAGWIADGLVNNKVRWPAGCVLGLALPLRLVAAQ